MAYHPLYDGLWHHEDLEGASFEEKAFFIFLWSNERIRPSGIYRVSTAQLAADTTLPEKRVRAYLQDLHARRRIVRDGAWLFIRGYLARQPNQPRLMLGVERDVKSCSSVPVLTSFGEKYPIHRKWSDNRLVTLTDTSHELARPEQLQSRAVTEQSIEATGPNVVMSDDQFLDSMRQNPAYAGIDLDRELGKMDAWLATPKGRGRRKTRQFVVNWLNKIDRPVGPASSGLMNPANEAVARRFLERHKGEP